MACTLALLAAFAAMRAAGLELPSQPAMLVLGVVLSSYLGGVTPGLVSAGAVWLYLAFYFSTPGELFRYQPDNLLRVVAWTFSLPVIACLVGLLNAVASAGARTRLEKAALEAELEERRRIETSLRASEARLRALHESNPLMIFTIDPECRVLDVNPAGAEQLGYAPGELVGGSVLAVFETADRDAVRAQIAACFRNPEQSLRWEMIKVRKDGRRIHVRETSRVFHDADGSPRLLIVCEDVTERRIAEEKIRKSEERYSLVANSMGDFVSLATPDRRTLYVSPSFFRLTGYSADDVTASDFSTRVHPEDAERVEHSRLANLRGEQTRTEWRCRRRDGQYVWLETLATPVPGPDGSVATITCSSRDISDRKRAEAALRESEERLRIQFDRMPIGCVVLDLDTRVLDWNPAAEKIFGFTRGQILGRPCWDTIVPASARPYVEAIMRRLGEGDLESHGNNENVTRDGRTIICQWANTPLVDATGRVASVLCMVQDITARVHAENALRASEERLRRLFEASNDAIILADDAGRFLQVNPAACVLFGLDDHRLLSLSARDIPTPPGARLSPDGFLRAVTGGGQGEFIILRAGGQRRIAEFSARPITGNLHMAVLRDITDRRGLEDELRQAQKLEAVGRLASGVAHDFNNLLTAIFGHTDLAKKTLPPNHPATRSLERVEEAARQAVGVTRSLLTFARAGAVEKHPIRLERAVEEAVRLFRRALPARIELFSDLEPHAPLWINADSTQIQQIVLNLGLNARDAMPDGGTLRISVAPCLEDGVDPPASRNGVRPRFARLVVEDNGTGMPPDVVPHIFEPFFTTKPPGAGTGLGLPIVHGIVSDHGGRIDVRSDPGRGTAFTVVFPCTEPSVLAAAPGPPAASAIGAGKLALLAEDNRHVREIIVSMLVSLGYEVVPVRGGHELLAAFAAANPAPSVLILDQDMPGKSGRECLAELRDSGRDTPAILITGGVEPIDDDRLDERTAILYKPFQLSQLATALEQAMRLGTAQGGGA